MDNIGAVGAVLEPNNSSSGDLIGGTQKLGGRNNRSRWVVWVGRVTAPLVVGGIWELCVSARIVDPAFSSTPIAVLRETLHQLVQAEMYAALWSTLYETLVGFVLASIAGVAFGIAMGHSRTLREIAQPYITAINSLPRIALAPLFVIWFGLGPESKIALVISLTFFVLLFSTLGGLATIDPDIVRLGRTLGFKGLAFQLKFVFRWALPAIFQGLELGLVTSFLGAVTGEMLGSAKGMGVLLSSYANLFETAKVMALLLILSVVASLFAVIMRRVAASLAWE